MKNVFIIGAKGYRKNYGGWETFITKLVDNYNDGDTKFYVSEISDKKEVQETNYNNVTVTSIYTPKVSSATMLIYSIKAMFYYLKYIQKNSIKDCYIYILGLKMGPFLSLLKRKLKKLDIKVLVNPDGLEWKRSKWNYFIKQYFKLSERMMLYNCDEIICDSIGIEEYLNETYKKLEVKKTYIPYGVDEIDLSNINEEAILNKYNLVKDNYHLMVGRFVPENNHELVIKEFMKTNSKKQLVIISNIEKNKYYYKLLENTKFNTDKRIVLLDAVYDQYELSSIRKSAYSYIHGHSVGGTNPSLLEALSVTKVNILYNCVFNEKVGLDSCLYFNDESNNLKEVLEKSENLTFEEVNSYSEKALKRIEDEYTWKKVVNQYKQVFN